MIRFGWDDAKHKKRQGTMTFSAFLVFIFSVSNVLP